ncbi:hypothetical protein C475_17503 [Halosimplex carlsbadense 2-9-1]|uniref:Integral membrane protein n=1 Tax=Halosimplex carlsbadense 2-9-1 TaxID=797114 RepID=M0CGF1_9EURY|nr:hypothetical protein [Halosimplex carlsbadense]ELZ22331.1 hypothetical protein C475_17503 [Halosimplex carlsbadense 2-9-1]
MTERDGRPGDEPEPDIDDVLDDLEALEELVDRPEEREQVRETMRTARRANRPRVVGRIRDAFDLRDAGEAVVGAFLFGIPMIVEGGTQEIGEAIAHSPVAVALTGAFGFVVVLGVLHAAQFGAVEADLIAGVVPRRLVGILAISGGMAVGLMTLWRRVDWSQPEVAAAQCLVTAVVMGVGASLGDVLPE